MRRSADGSQSASSITAFTPRQVLLLKQRNTTVSGDMANDRSEQRVSTKTDNQKVEDNSVLTYSVALWLQNKGFSKVLKRFLSAAQILDNNWKDRALDLNDIYCKYQEAVNIAREGIKIQKKLEDQIVLSTDANGDVDSLVTEEGGRMKNKKKCRSNGDADGTGNAPHEELVNPEKQVSEEGRNLKKKKNTISGAIPDQVVNENGNGKQDEHRDQTTKKKDKKRSNSSTQALDADEKKPVKDSTNDLKSEEASKKRKRMPLEGTEYNTGNETTAEEVKSKKIKKLKKDLDDVLKTAENGYLDETHVENDILPSQDSLKNNFLVNGCTSSGSKSSGKKASNSTEPKTVNAFQRVKVDEVTFTDDRLQDNSYWAKDGAESGYGAKAQEVLGQVKGRDFRHEKTKKKRGSYRGGQIDLDSHSIKFNYSDDE